ncbi:hypothetical protein PILCRDRAFT_821198 [Piloderma croceum F 1598]|uniref:Uncharacterized protein n=1 Tax=Piloderma croceum (strain F 1598) TaxID=765440 RepID=A0A0C3FQ49_PILCF|nr:hypothetical protein PILCRDRAFT_821198 [Piloderma croceum F 1598]
MKIAPHLSRVLLEQEAIKSEVHGIPENLFSYCCKEAFLPQTRTSIDPAPWS